jgi:hypothetical protein
MEHFQLIITASDAPVSLIALIRKHTSLPLGDIKQAISSGSPIVDAHPHHNEYDDFIATATTLLDQLESKNIPFKTVVDGVEQPVEYVRNLFQSWNDIGEQIHEEDELRFEDEQI